MKLSCCWNAHSTPPHFSLSFLPTHPLVKIRYASSSNGKPGFVLNCTAPDGRHVRLFAYADTDGLREAWIQAFVETGVLYYEVGVVSGDCVAYLQLTPLLSLSARAPLAVAGQKHLRI